MWFGRKENNRRSVERDELLDVKLRASQVRSARMRTFGIVFGVILAAAIVAVVGWRGGRFLLDKFIYQNEAFAIRQIEVQNDGIVTPEAVRQWAGVRLGDNLLGLDLMKVKQALESQPCLQSVSVERLLPQTLRLRVSEREAIAQTVVTQPRPDGNYEQVVFHFDEAGYVMKPLDAKFLTPQAQPAALEHLPLLLGVKVTEIQLGQQVESANIRAALQLLSEFERSPMSGFADLQRINVSIAEVLEATTSQGAEITFGLTQLDVQLRRWRLIYDQYQKWGKAIASLDLSVSNNLPVRFVSANSVAPLPPKPAKPPRTKKKHV